MASVEGVRPRPNVRWDSRGWMVNRLSIDSSSFHHCMRLWGYTGNLQKRMGFMSFSQHTCLLYEQSRRSGLLIIGMGTLMEGDISQQSASSRQRAWAQNVCHANWRCGHRTGPIHGIGLQPLSWQCLEVDQIGQYETACQCSIACTYKPLSCHFHMLIYRNYK